MAAADSKMERKYQERLGRLAALNELRLQEASARKSSTAAGADPRESVDAFLASFSQKREAVEVGLALGRTREIQESLMKEHLDSLAEDVSALGKSVADAAYFLPASVMKASQNTVVQLRDQLEIANAELVPKKKFSFRNKAKKPADSGPAPSETMPESLSNATGAEEADGTAAAQALIGDGGVDRGRASSAQPIEADDAERIVGKLDARFVREAGEMGEELTLSNLSNCAVYLKGRLTALVVHSVRNCRIFAGPVTGSVYVENVASSVLVLAAHQIRIHSTTGTDFYLRARSKPIVEFTSKNRFAPYAFAYEGVLEDLQAANLAEETGLWEKVDDFRWLRAVPSPNWSVLPIEERISAEDGSLLADAGDSIA